MFGSIILTVSGGLLRVCKGAAMPKKRSGIGAAGLLTGLILACASTAAAVLAFQALETPTTLALPDTGGPRQITAAAGPAASLLAATAPSRAEPSLDEWTSDAPALPARPAHVRVAHASAPPAAPHAPVQAQAADPKTEAQGAPATPKLALAAAPAKDETKLCKNPALPMDIAQAAASTIRLREQSGFKAKPLDIPPPGPAPEQERRLRLSALLADALSQ
jgi:hypothetical protein